MSRKILFTDSHCDDNIYAWVYEVSLNEVLEYKDKLNTSDTKISKALVQIL